MSKIAARFDLAPADAVKYFQDKGALLSFDYTDVEKETHAHAFTVAKVTSFDLLRTIHQEVDRSIGQGQTFEEYKRRLRWQLQERGWWGKQEALDIDTGEITKVQLGSNRRLRTIYQTNVQTAYMAGRYKRYAENAEQRPYWKYIAVMDSRTRPAHAALHGKVFRWDDPIWSVIWPPNGWGCRCRVQALTEAEFQTLGIPLENGQDALVEKEVILNRDGDTTTVQGLKYTGDDGKEHAFYPDPGWDYNPGKAWARFDKGGDLPDSDWGTFPGEKTISLKPEQKTWQDYGRPEISTVPPEHRLETPPLIARAPDRETAVKVLGEALGVSEESPLRIITTPIEEVSIRHEWLSHIVEKETHARERYGNFIIPSLMSPYEIWTSEYEDGGFRNRYIGLFKDEGFLMVVRINQDGSLFWNMIKARSSYLNNNRSGILVFKK